MSEKRGLPLISFVLAALVVAILLPGRNAIAQDQRHEAETLLVKIVADIVSITRENGYDMPEYVVRNGASDAPISGPPIRHAFFAYVYTGWIDREPTIRVHFYEADQIPMIARMRVITYLIELHEAQGHRFSLELLMIKKNYRKLESIPKALVEIKLNRIER